jgi:polyisoprenoid-binding protein YceI
MRQTLAKCSKTCALALLTLALFIKTAPLASAQNNIPPAEFVLTIDPAQSKLHWNVDSTLHMVHGTFALKSGTVHINPETGSASGEIVASALSGESGNGSRDKRMHKEILETAKYPDLVFHPTHVEGTVKQAGTFEVKLSGTMSIHGADHEVTARVRAELTGDRWNGTSDLEVPYVKWGIKDPSNFLLKVKPLVHVELEMVGQVSTK